MNGNAERLDNLATIFLLSPLTILSARGVRAPSWMVAGLVVVTLWQAYRAIVGLTSAQPPASTSAFATGVLQ